jgi:hypothetical protein
LNKFNVGKGRNPEVLCKKNFIPINPDRKNGRFGVGRSG